MNKKPGGKNANRKSRNVVTAAPAEHKHEAGRVESLLKEGSSTVESLLPTGSAERVAVGVAAAAGGALVAAATLGVGPTALAGTAGYVAYRGMKKGHDKDASHKL
jgi:hypothetical protein